jgi:hypothetical protein
VVDHVDVVTAVTARIDGSIHSVDRRIRYQSASSVWLSRR